MVKQDHYQSEIATSLADSYAPLPWKEQLALFADQGTDRWLASRERLFRANTLLILNQGFRIYRTHHVFKGPHKRPDLLDDMLSVLSQTMLEALDAFEAERGFRFTTLFCRIAFRKVYRWALRLSSPLTLPTNPVKDRDYLIESINRKHIDDADWLTRAKAYELNDETPPPCARLDESEDRKRFYDYVDNQLSETERESVYDYLSGLSLIEIGKARGISRQAVSLRLHSAINRMRADFPDSVTRDPDLFRLADIRRRL